MQYDEISRNAIPKKSRRNNNYKGTIICVTAVMMLLCVAFNAASSITNIIYGILGWFSYAVLLVLFAVGLMINFKKKIKIHPRFVILGGLMLFALFTAVHLAFTHAQLKNSIEFKDYLVNCFKPDGRTPGGIVFALPTYILFAVCQLEGSFVLLGVLFIICASMIAAHVVTTGNEKPAVTLAENQFEIEQSETKKPNNDYKKASKELQATLDAKYQEMLRKQSATRIAAGKSELGLNNAMPKSAANAIYDNPVPLGSLQPINEVSAPEQINQWSTEAAQKFNAGMNYPAFGQQLGQSSAFGGQQQFNQQFGAGQPAVTFNQGTAFNQGMAFGSGQSFQSQPPYNPQQFADKVPADIAQDRVNRRLERAKQRLGMAGNLDDRINARGTGTSRGGLASTGEQISMEVKPQKLPYKPRHYIKPPLSLIRTESTSLAIFHQDALERQKLLDIKLKEFGVNANVTGFTVAPAVTRFEVQLETGARVAHVEQLSKDISYALGSKQIRLEIVEGKNAIGIEVPNKAVGLVSLKDILASTEFTGSKSPLTIAIGKNLDADCVTGDISTMPHLLIAGSTGTGKSVCLNTLLISLLYRAHPDEVKLLLVDPKCVELNQYNDGPHMLIPSAITNVKQAINALKWLEYEMRRRYDILRANGVNNVGLYHALPAYQSGSPELERLPYIVMVIDEAADLLQQGKKDVEASIQSLSSLARACGIHIILATQRPSTDVITGVIKNNFVVRMAFQVANRHDSATIINDTGAEKLVGRGDMLYIEKSNCQRIQCAFVELSEATAVMNFIRRNNEADFDYELENIILNGLPNNNNAGADINSESKIGNGSDIARGKAGQDELFVPILKWMVREDNITKTISISNIQRHFNVGFARAGRIIDQLAEAGYVSSGAGTKARSVLVNQQEVDEAYGE